jgi:hypothetical protein
VVVKMQIEQRAVHIQKHTLDFIPWDQDKPA